MIDVTVVYERTGASFIEAYRLREQRYKSVFEEVLERHHCDHVSFRGLTVGARGSMFHKHISDWRALGFNDHNIYITAMRCLKDSIRIYNSFNKAVLMGGRTGGEDMGNL